MCKCCRNLCIYPLFCVGERGLYSHWSNLLKNLNNHNKKVINNPYFKILDLSGSVCLFLCVLCVLPFRKEAKSFEDLSLFYRSFAWWPRLSCISTLKWEQDKSIVHNLCTINHFNKLKMLWQKLALLHSFYPFFLWKLLLHLFFAKFWKENVVTCDKNYIPKVNMNGRN